MSRTTEQPLPWGLLLAAGGSTRLGRAKQLVQLNGVSLVRRSAKNLLALKLPGVSVVTGCKAGAVRAQLANLPLRAVVNETWESGMGSSIAAGIRSIETSADGLLILLVDQWRIGPDELQRLVETWQSDISQIVAASWNGNTGPPVVFPARLRTELEELAPERGAKDVLRKHPDSVRTVAMASAAYDLDTAEDLRLLRSFEASVPPGPRP